MNRYCILIIASLALFSCSKTPESRIESVLGDLEKVLNHHDTSAIRTLYLHQQFKPVMDTGDSSTIYRMLVIPGGKNFSVEHIKVTIIDQKAYALFDIVGEVHHDTLSGVMSLPMKLEFEQDTTGDWKIVGNSETRQ